MKHAVLIMAHKNIGQVERLIETLSGEFDIFLHLDAKMNVDKSDIKRLTDKFSNLYLTENRIDGVMYHWRLVEITLELIKKATRISNELNIKYRYYILLSGQDYPIKSPLKIKNFLNKNYPLNFIDINSGKDHLWIQSLSKRIRFIRGYYWIERKFSNKKLQFLLKLPIYFFQEILTILLGSPASKFKKNGFEIYAGSAWWILNDISIEQVLDFVENSSVRNSSQKKILKAFKNCIGPDESFFQSVFMEGLRGSVDTEILNSKSLRYIDWGDGELKPFSQTGSPYILMAADIHRLLISEALFARKFDSDLDNQILDLLDESFIN